MESSIIEIPETKNCSICLKENLTNEILCSTNCTHNFCKECLDQWLDTGKSTCPLCRQNIQYFQHKGNQFRIVYQLNRRNSRNNIENNIQNNLLITRLYRQNITLKFIFCSLISILFVGYIYYSLLYDDYNQLSNSYKQKMSEIGLLRSELNLCYSFGDQEVSVLLIGPENQEKQCLIQRSSYYRCFHE